MRPSEYKRNKLPTAFEIVRQIENWPQPRPVVMVEKAFSLEEARLIDEPKEIEAGETNLRWGQSTTPRGKSKDPFGSRSGYRRFNVAQRQICAQK